uniref:Uncharacterized protein LOC105112764 n=1 Tax=Rhizophora mucronata TaxID=61149 RepID=A0A2P2LKT1_RHIMU
MIGIWTCIFHYFSIPLVLTTDVCIGKMCELKESKCLDCMGLINLVYLSICHGTMVLGSVIVHYRALPHSLQDGIVVYFAREYFFVDW